MMHDFSLTTKHVIFYDLPVTFDAALAAEMAAPKALRLPARLMLSALIGRVKVPDSMLASESSRIPATAGSSTSGTPPIRPALA